MKFILGVLCHLLPGIVRAIDRSGASRKRRMAFAAVYVLTVLLAMPVLYQTAARVLEEQSEHNRQATHAQGRMADYRLALQAIEICERAEAEGDARHAFYCSEAARAYSDLFDGWMQARVQMLKELRAYAAMRLQVGYFSEMLRRDHPPRLPPTWIQQIAQALYTTSGLIAVTACAIGIYLAVVMRWLLRAGEADLPPLPKLP